MKILEKITEDEMISVFLLAEIHSSRFGARIRKFVKQLGVSKEVVLNPDLKDEKQNRQRKNILEKHRYYKSRKRFFESFPADVQWYRAEINPREFRKLFYINEEYWVLRSHGSRLASDGAKSVLSGEKIFSESNRVFYDVARSLDNKTQRPIILVAQNKTSKRVVMEGHVRMTAYSMRQKKIPKRMRVLVGFSKRMNEWDLY